MQVFLVLVILGAISINCAKVPVAQKDFSFSINGKKIDVANGFYGNSRDFQQNNWATDVNYVVGRRTNGDPLLFEFQGSESYSTPVNITTILTYPTPDVNRSRVISAIEAIVGQYPSVSQHIEILEGAIGTRNISLAFDHTNNLRINFAFRVYARR